MGAIRGDDGRRSAREPLDQVRRALDLGTVPTREHRSDLAHSIAEVVRTSGRLVLTVDRLSTQQLVDLRWAVQLAARRLRTPLQTRALKHVRTRQVEIRVEPKAGG